MIKFVLFLWLGIVQTISTPALSHDEESVRQARLDQNCAMATGDTGRAAMFWTDDITLRRGLGTSVMGKGAYIALIEKEKGLVYVREPDLIEVSSHWPLAYESGIWMALQENTAIITGRYSAQWVKRDGNWLIRSEVFVALTCIEGCTALALP